MTNQRGMEYIDSKIKNDWVEKSTHYRENLGKEAFENEVSLYGKEMQERYAVLNRLDKEGVNLLLSPDSSSKFIVPGFGVFAGAADSYERPAVSGADGVAGPTADGLCDLPAGNGAQHELDLLGGGAPWQGAGSKTTDRDGAAGAGTTER